MCLLSRSRLRAQALVERGWIVSSPGFLSASRQGCDIGHQVVMRRGGRLSKASMFSQQDT